MPIKERFKVKADNLNTEIKDILKNHGSKKIGEVTLSQIYSGMRGMTGLVSETSLLDPQETTPRSTKIKVIGRVGMARA